jgi:hypothetical protein
MGAPDVRHRRRTLLPRRPNQAAGCMAVNCEGAIRRAWDDLCSLGANEISAFRTCTTLYLLRHPGTSLHEARESVAAWLDRQ